MEYSIRNTAGTLQNLDDEFEDMFWMGSSTHWRQKIKWWVELQKELQRKEILSKKINEVAMTQIWAHRFN